MLRKIPIVACPIKFWDLSSGFLSLSKGTSQSELCENFLEIFHSKHNYLLNSATSCFYTLLETLTAKSDKREVILPAYTASSLVTAVMKANLKPVLCDISLDDFNIDKQGLSHLISEETLCILNAHMFGIVSQGVRDIKENYPEILVIEDCAQAMGSRRMDNWVGSAGDFSIFSFNRGKNLPTYGGGCISTDNEHIAKKIAEEIKNAKTVSLKERLSIFVKLIALSLVVRPYIYGLIRPLIASLKDSPAPDDFEVKEYTDVQAGLALSLLKKHEKTSRQRYKNGMRLIEGLKDDEGLILPKISPETQPAFNRFPMLFKDLGRREEVESNLSKAGIETSRMYLKPLHHQFDLGYQPEEFPNAVYFAEHLITLPVHSLVEEEDLFKMIDCIKKNG